MTWAKPRNWSRWNSFFQPWPPFAGLAYSQSVPSPISCQRKGGHRIVQPRWFLLGARGLTSQWHQEIMKFNTSFPRLGKSTKEAAHTRATWSAPCKCQRSHSLLPSAVKRLDQTCLMDQSTVQHLWGLTIFKHCMLCVPSLAPLKPLHPARSIASLHNALNFIF